MEQGITPPPFAVAQPHIPTGSASGGARSVVASGGARSVATEANSAKRGFMLITVLVITAVGLLFGAGALLLFRYQCQMRIDRQHELEKVYAVRSALNYTRQKSVTIPDGGKEFAFHTVSGRDLKLFVKPAGDIFPDPTNDLHFVMERGDFVNASVSGGSAPRGWYNSSLDYECGWIGATNLVMGNSDGERFGIAFEDKSENTDGADNMRWWINIGMRGTGGWLQEDYGRRYFFHPRSYAGTDSQNNGDSMRLCVIRNVTNRSDQVGAGCRHGWPLSQEGEKAIVFQVREIHGSSAENRNATVALYEFAYSGGVLTQTPIDIGNFQCPSRTRMGIQLADDKICVFYIENAAGELVDKGKPKGGYVFSNIGQLSTGMYEYFSGEIQIGGTQYKGIWTNDYGQIQAPELRVVVEAEATAEKRKNGNLGSSDVDFLTRFRVTPAYQYDVFVEHPATVTNRATVAQITGTGGRGGTGYTMLTYDTHGTDNKGFRKDEKDFEEAKREKGQ